MSSDDILRVVLNDGSYIATPEEPTGDRVTANGSLNLLFADKNFIFGMLKNEEETVLPELDFSFNMGELNSAIQYITYSTEKYSQMLPYETVFIETDELYVGESRVESEGENGIAENVYEVAYADGKEISRKLVSSTVITEAVDRVEYVGTKEYPSVAPTGSFIWPLQQKFVITSRFGINREGLDAWGEKHLGIDLAGVPRNTPIYAADGGTVVFAGTNGTYGKLVRIRHENGVETYYAHMNFISVKVGDQVYQGQQLGGVGATGKVTGAHLHFEVRFNGTVVNPEKYLPAERPQ
jgi:murein DD-endopeptidase MepM/ murein hydrolase activator NlpD